VLEDDIRVGKEGGKKLKRRGQFSLLRVAVTASVEHPFKLWSHAHLRR
jgi:hypothetical protein